MAKNRNRILVSVLAVVVVLAGAGAAVYLVRARQYVSTNDASIDANSVSISSRIGGRISELTVGEGDRVQSGQVLVRLDDSDQLAQKALAESNVTVAQQNQRLAEIRAQQASQDYNRIAGVYQAKGVSEEQYAHARDAVETAKAQADLASSQVKAAQAQLGAAEVQLASTTISSPVAGVVARRWQLVGEIVAPGQAILTVNELENVWVTANIEETKLARIRVGDPVDISVDAFPRTPLKGRVALLGAGTASQFSLIPASNASGNFTKVTQRVPVRIELEPPAPEADPDLLPGMSVRVTVKVSP